MDVILESVPLAQCAEESRYTVRVEELFKTKVQWFGCCIGGKQHEQSVKSTTAGHTRIAMGVFDDEDLVGAERLGLGMPNFFSAPAPREIGFESTKVEEVWGCLGWACRRASPPLHPEQKGPQGTAQTSAQAVEGPFWKDAFLTPLFILLVPISRPFGIFGMPKMAQNHMEIEIVFFCLLQGRRRRHKFRETRFIARCWEHNNRGHNVFNKSHMSNRRYLQSIPSCFIRRLVVFTTTTSSI